VSEDEQVAVGRQDREFALAVRLVGRTVNVAFGERVELGLEFGVERVNVVDIDVIAKPAIARRRAIVAVILQDAYAGGFALNISVVVESQPDFEAEQVAEERDGLVQVGHVHERRDADEHSFYLSAVSS